MPFLRQILSDRAVTEVILLKAPRASVPFDYENLGATVHESHDTLSALATISILKQRQRPKQGYPREPRSQIALIYCKRSHADDIPMMHRLLRHLKSAHPEIGIWCLAEDDMVIEVNTQAPWEPTRDDGDEKPRFSDHVPTRPAPIEHPPSEDTSAYGTLKFRGSFVPEVTSPVGESKPEPSREGEPDSASSDEFDDPDSTQDRTDPTISAEEMEMLFHDSDEDHEDGRSDSDTTEDPGR